MGMLNRQRYNAAQAEGRTGAIQYEYRREGDDGTGKMILATRFVSVARLTQRVRAVDELERHQLVSRARLHACSGARHRRIPGARPVHHHGSRRTGAGSRAGPDDGDPEPPGLTPRPRRQQPQGARA
jgi:hypothetical protein